MVCFSENMEGLISCEGVKVLATETQRIAFTIEKMISRLETKDYRLKTNLSLIPRILESLKGVVKIDRCGVK